MAAQTYPDSLGAEHRDPYVFDLDHFENLLCENSKRRFVGDDQIDITVVEVGLKDWIIHSSKELEEYLRTTRFRGTRLISITQKYSWDRLSISENGFRQLLHYFSIFPAFMNIVCAFGKMTSDSSDSLGGHYSWKHGNVSEMCYLLKSVEKHGRADSEDPWSIRQLGVYHQHDTDNESDTFVLLNPTKSFEKRLEIAQLELKKCHTSSDIHMLALSHSTWQWRWYLTFWESQLSELLAKAHISNVEGRKDNDTMPVLTIEYEDFQEVQSIHDRMNSAKYILGSNVQISEKIHGSLKLTFSAEMLLDELRLQSARVDNLLERTRNGSRLMQDIISFRGLAALKTSSDNSNEMARLADLDSKNMVKLTTKAQKDAGMLKRMTLLTSIYLPASFVSQFLSMGYLKLNSANHPISFNFAAEMWVFVVLTILLLGTTFIVWLYLDSVTGWWCRRKTCKQALGDEEG